jgi:hypothetical protein
MARWARWLVATGATLLTFWVVLWVVRVASFSWLPQAEADRWVVAVGFATVAAAAVAAPTVWWAQRERNADSEHADSGPTAGVQQRARTSGHSSVTQVGGDQHITARQQP